MPLRMGRWTRKLSAPVNSSQIHSKEWRPSTTGDSDCNPIHALDDSAGSKTNGTNRSIQVTGPTAGETKENEWIGVNSTNYLLASFRLQEFLESMRSRVYSKPRTTTNPPCRIGNCPMKQRELNAGTSIRLPESEPISGPRNGIPQASRSGIPRSLQTPLPKLALTLDRKRTRLNSSH